MAFHFPTHTVLAFQQALKELEAEGGIETRYSRYLANNHVLRQNDRDGVPAFHSRISGPFITSFLYPKDWRFDFNHFYQYLKQNGFVIYPGKSAIMNVFVSEILARSIRKIFWN